MGFRSYTTTAIDGATAAITMPIPADVVQYDALIAAITYPDAGALDVWTLPSGWTQQAYQSAATTNDLLVCTKIAGSAEPADYTWTDTTGAVNGIYGFIIAYAVPHTFLDGIPTATDTLTNTAPSGLTGDEDTQLFIWMSAAAAPVTLTIGGGTERLNLPNAYQQSCLAVSDEVLTSTTAQSYTALSAPAAVFAHAVSMCFGPSVTGGYDAWAIA